MTSDELVGRNPDVSSAADEAAEVTSHLLFALGDTLFSVPTGYVARIAEEHQPVRVPTAPNHFIGVVNVRGQILTLVDLHHLLQVSPVSATDSSSKRLVALALPDRPFAFVADAVLGIRDIPVAEIRSHGGGPGEFDQPEGTVTILEPKALAQQLA